MKKEEKPQLTVSNFNLKQLNTEELSLHVRSSIQIGSNLAVFGQRGTGKTVIIKNQIKKADMIEVYLNLSVMERVDIGGYPNIHSKTSYVDFLLPKYTQLLIEGNKKCALVLDEVDKADPATWAPLLELVQFHSINGINFPNLSSVIMTGNLIAEGGNRPSLPLLDRTEAYMVSSNPELWLRWAGSEGKIHPSITAFINDNGDDLHCPVDAEERYKDRSPRGWENASKIIFAGEALHWQKEVINAKVAGCVGNQAGDSFMNYYNYYQGILPLVDKLLQGGSINKEFSKLQRTEQIVLCMVTCSRLANIMDKSFEINKTKKTKKTRELTEALDNLKPFLSYVEPEMMFIAFRCQIQAARIQQHDLANETKSTKGWADMLRRGNER